MTIVFVVVGVIFAILFNVLYLNKIVRFIREFQAKMKQVEHGDLSTRMSVFSFPELKKLATGFNQMVEKIVFLLEQIKHEQERKKKAEFQVLQNQINPHFLYNTLESINALAAMNGQKDISKLTFNLGKLLRISISADDEVNVQEEIRHVKSYMEIQKVRYDERFTFKVDVDERLHHHLILKLVLQPLVENILYHAFDREHEDALITIRGEMSGSQGCFYIEDNGKGIRTEVLEAFRECNQDVDTNRKDVIGHGVMNVHDRLRIYYGSGYGLMICSMEGEGTIMKLTFPLYKDEGRSI
jgi:two-component system sensor histidine kinase YesM